MGYKQLHGGETDWTTRHDYQSDICLSCFCFCFCCLRLLFPSSIPDYVYSGPLAVVVVL